MKTDRKSLNSNLLRQWLTLGAIVAAFGVNVYANIAPPNGLTIGDISNKFFGEVQIIPANYAFAIWGIIYLGLLAFGIYQVMPAQRQNTQVESVGYLLAVASLAQIVWVFLFEYQFFGLSVVAMLGILLPLIVIYLRLGIGKERVSRKDKWFVHIPLSIYLAWISVATIVNVASTLYYWGWNGWGISPQLWTIIMLIVAAAIAATIIRNGVDIAYPLVVIWAFVAIAVRQANQRAIAGWAIALALALGFLLLVNVWRKKTQKL